MRTFLVVIFAFGLSGCYHASVTTGLTPSAQVIDEPFATSWIYGLVPPETVEAANECENGVARVETQLSFVNQLVGLITFGIYTPMHITVTCASGTVTGSADVRVNDDLDVLSAFEHAADLAVDDRRSVSVSLK